MKRSMKLSWHAVGVAALLALSGAPVAGQAENPPGGQAAGTIGQEATLRPGDLVGITVWRRDELSGEFRVNAEGGLNHPLYREVQVADVSLETAEARLLSYLRRLEADPLLAMRPFFRVSIAGEVQNPGMYDMPPETTIAEAVAVAGGLSPQAKAAVELVRGMQITEMDLRAPGSAAATMPIRSGDRITVLRRGGFNFISHVFLPLMTTATTVVSIINLSQ